MEKRDYYEVLGVREDHLVRTLKKAYRQQALKYHPDRNQGNKEAEDKFKEASPKPMRCFPMMKSARSMMHMAMQVYPVKDLKASQMLAISSRALARSLKTFLDSLEVARGAAELAKGADMRYDLVLEFEEAAFGVEKDIEYDRDVICGSCDGSRAEPGGKKTCTTCGGSGQVRRTQGFFSVAAACPTCHGEGEVITNPCKACKGRGKSL